MKKQLSTFGITLQLILWHSAHTTEFINKNGSEFNKPWVKNFLQLFEQIPTKINKSDYLAAWTNNKIKEPRYTQSKENKWGIIEGGQNHFQTIMRFPQHLGTGNYIAITGSDPHGRDKDNPKTKGSTLIIIKMASENNKIAWTGNLDKNGQPNQSDNIVKVIKVDEDLWHAGGVDIEGKYLAVPIEKGGVQEDSGHASKVVIYDITNPENPTKVTQVERKGVKGGVASLIRLDDGHYLLGCWSDSDNKPIRYDFYYSKTVDMKDGFSTEPYTLPADKFIDHDKNKQYQNINFIRDYDSGNIYAVATLNTSKLAPVINGKDIADLFRIDYKGMGNITVTYLKKYQKHFFCKDNQCNFNAGTGIFIPNSDGIALYAVPHWLNNDGKTLHFNQYAYIKNSVELDKIIKKAVK